MTTLLFKHYRLDPTDNITKTLLQHNKKYNKKTKKKLTKFNNLIIEAINIKH